MTDCFLGLLKDLPRRAQISTSHISERSFVAVLDSLTVFDLAKLTTLDATFWISGTICIPEDPFPTTATFLLEKS